MEFTGDSFKSFSYQDGDCAFSFTLEPWSYTSSYRVGVSGTNNESVSFLLQSGRIYDYNDDLVGGYMANKPVSFDMFIQKDSDTPTSQHIDAWIYKEPVFFGKQAFSTNYNFDKFFIETVSSGNVDLYISGTVPTISIDPSFWFSGDITGYASANNSYNLEVYNIESLTDGIEVMQADWNKSVGSGYIYAQSDNSLNTGISGFYLRFDTNGGYQNVFFSTQDNSTGTYEPILSFIGEDNIIYTRSTGYYNGWFMAENPIQDIDISLNYMSGTGHVYTNIVGTGLGTGYASGNISNGSGTFTFYNLSGSLYSDQGSFLENQWGLDAQKLIYPECDVTGIYSVLATGLHSGVQSYSVLTGMIVEPLVLADQGCTNYSGMVNGTPNTSGITDSGIQIAPTGTYSGFVTGTICYNNSYYAYVDDIPVSGYCRYLEGYKRFNNVWDLRTGVARDTTVSYKANNWYDDTSQSNDGIVADVQTSDGINTYFANLGYNNNYTGNGAPYQLPADPFFRFDLDYVAPADLSSSPQLIAAFRDLGTSENDATCAAAGRRPYWSETHGYAYGPDYAGTADDYFEEWVGRYIIPADDDWILGAVYKNTGTGTLSSSNGEAFGFLIQSNGTSDPNRFYIGCRQTRRLGILYSGQWILEFPELVPTGEKVAVMFYKSGDTYGITTNYASTYTATQYYPFIVPSTLGDATQIGGRTSNNTSAWSFSFKTHLYDMAFYSGAYNQDTFDQVYRYMDAKARDEAYSYDSAELVISGKNTDYGVAVGITGYKSDNQLIF